MNIEIGYQGNKHMSQLISKIRVVVHDGRYIVQGRLPFYRGFLFRWYNIQQNKNIEGYSNTATDKWSDLEEAKKFANDLSEEVAHSKVHYDRLEKNGKIVGTFDIKSIKDDPEFFV